MNIVIKETLAYIDNHLEEDIEISTLAKRAGYSVYYFQRMFSSVTDYGVREYIRQRKLTRAAFDLINSSESIISISLKYGFQTPESFSKAFKLQHKVSPIEFRKSNPTIIATPPLSKSRKKEKNLNVRIEVIHEEIVNGYRHIVSLENNENLSVIPKLWDTLNDNGDDKRLFAINDGAIKGILGICKKISDNQIEYWIGVNSQERNENYETMLIPESRYAVFEVVGPLPDAIQRGWKEIMTDWITTSDYDIDETFDFELTTDEDPIKEDLKSEIWIKLK